MVNELHHEISDRCDGWEHALGVFEQVADIVQAVLYKLLLTVIGVGSTIIFDQISRIYDNFVHKIEKFHYKGHKVISFGDRGLLEKLDVF